MAIFGPGVEANKLSAVKFLTMHVLGGDWDGYITANIPILYKIVHKKGGDEYKRKAKYGV